MGKGISTRQGAPSGFETTGATTPPSSVEMASVSRTCEAITAARRRSRQSARVRSPSAVRIRRQPQEGRDGDADGAARHASA